MFSLPEHLSLRHHPTARNQTVATCLLPAGTHILSVQSLASLLLPKEKGQRCDFCHCLAPQDRGHLQRCTGCASYWYCDATCQTLHWRTHKKYCKHLGAFCASRAFGQLASHEQIDALFLTHLLAECAARDTEDPELSIFMSLLPGTGGDVPPSCPLGASQRPVKSPAELFSRCGNNNFSIHSHLTTIAHGAFPLASRLFNHSCVPNAVHKYRLARASPVVMEVVVIREIAPGEEICIPYVDPALLETRQHMFRFTYGFTCACLSCTALERLDTSLPASGQDELSSLGRSLVEFVFPDSSPEGITLPSLPIYIDAVPLEVLPILREGCLTRFCESFSTFSHEGPFQAALEVGLTVLAFYVVVYPPGYPQIGMFLGVERSVRSMLELGTHLLEMAKTAWNAFITAESADRLLGQARAYLRLSKQVWAVVGSEGDEGGPLAEIEVLERLTG